MGGSSSRTADPFGEGDEGALDGFIGGFSIITPSTVYVYIVSRAARCRPTGAMSNTASIYVGTSGAKFAMEVDKIRNPKQIRRPKPGVRNRNELLEATEPEAGGTGEDRAGMSAAGD